MSDTPTDTPTDGSQAIEHLDDAAILARIRELVAEEHEERRSGHEHVEGEHSVAQIEVLLDQCWDLLRQRRAREEFDQDPDDSAVRPAGTVENYRQ